MPWLTPNEIPATTLCRRLLIPDDLEIVAAVSGALLSLTYAHNWEQFGTVTPEEIASAMQEMYFEWFDTDTTCIYPLADETDLLLMDDADATLREG